jgi:hypothetical protein
MAVAAHLPLRFGPPLQRRSPQVLQLQRLPEQRLVRLVQSKLQLRERPQRHQAASKRSDCS